jgi:hypothetical protein
MALDQAIKISFGLRERPELSKMVYHALRGASMNIVN